jgi:membrane associated rhomboid family serine protease
MFYFGLVMKSRWNQSRVDAARERISGSMRGFVGQFGSVTHFLIWLTVAIFLLQLVCQAVRWPIIEPLFALSAPQLFKGYVWQPVTYMFLHADLWHILINLMLLWFFGREVEYFIGPKYFTRLYFLAGIAGAGLWLAFNFASYSYLLGASAAVLGCVIAFATLFPEREVTLLVFFVLPVTLKAKYLALIAVAVDVWPLLSGTDTSVAHLAHLGGAALGYLYIKSLGYGATPRWLLWWRHVRDSIEKRRRTPDKRELSNEEFIREQIDPILDKIAREGMQSLTRRERKILESAKDLMQKHQR